MELGTEMSKLLKSRKKKKKKADKSVEAIHTFSTKGWIEVPCGFTTCRDYKRSVLEKFP